MNPSCSGLPKLFRQRNHTVYINYSISYHFERIFITLICVLALSNYQLIKGIIETSENSTRSFSPSKGEDLASLTTEWAIIIASPIQANIKTDLINIFQNLVEKSFDLVYLAIISQENVSNSWNTKILIKIDQK